MYRKNNNGNDADNNDKPVISARDQLAGSNPHLVFTT